MQLFYICDDKLIFIIKSFRVPKIKKILLYEMKFLASNYSCIQNPLLGGCRPQIPVLYVLCTLLNLLIPLSGKKKSWIRHYKEAVHQLLIICNKAYDSVRREALYNILIQFGIPMKLVRLIKLCLKHVAECG